VSGLPLRFARFTQCSVMSREFLLEDRVVAGCIERWFVVFRVGGRETARTSLAGGDEREA
jgi:hypothetical protein